MATRVDYRSVLVNAENQEGRRIRIFRPERMPQNLRPAFVPRSALNMSSLPLGLTLTSLTAPIAGVIQDCGSTHFTYGYDALNRLCTVVYNGTVVARYRYDVLGRRLRGGDEVAIAEQTGGAVVVERRNPEDVLCRHGSRSRIALRGDDAPCATAAQERTPVCPGILPPQFPQFTCRTACLFPPSGEDFGRF